MEYALEKASSIDKESKLNLARDCMHNPFQIPIKYDIKYFCVNLNIRRAFNTTMRAEF